MVRNKKPLMAILVLMMVVTYCRAGEFLQSMLRGPDQTNAWCGKRLVTARPPRSTKRFKQNTELRRHDRLKNQIIPWITKSGCSLGGRPSLRKDLRAPTRRIHQGAPESNTNTGTEVSAAVLERLWTQRDNT